MLTHFLHVLHLDEAHSNNIVDLVERPHGLLLLLFDQRHIHSFCHCYSLRFIHVGERIIKPASDHLFQRDDSIHARFFIGKALTAFPNLMQAVLRVLWLASLDRHPAI
jgi:hypothetical protein